MDTREDLQEKIAVPAGLKQELSDMIDSMDAAGKILSSGKSPARLIMTCIMGAAAGIVLFFGIWTAVETFRRPEDTFTDPETAYAEVEKAPFSISEKMNAGLEKAAEAEKTLDRSMETVKSLYLNKYNELQ